MHTVQTSQMHNEFELQKQRHINNLKIKKILLIFYLRHERMQFTLRWWKVQTFFKIVAEVLVNPDMGLQFKSNSR